MAKINISNVQIKNKFEGHFDIEYIYSNLISIQLSTSFENIQKKLKGDDK